MLTTSDRQPFYCQNTFYKQFMSVFTSTRSQNLPSPSLSPPPRREEATNWANSNIRTLNKTFIVYLRYPKFFPSYSRSRDPFVKITSLSITDKLLCCMFCPTYYDMSIFYLNSDSYMTGIGWIQYEFCLQINIECQFTFFIFIQFPLLSCFALFV